jgi:hypothetical protein
MERYLCYNFCFIIYDGESVCTHTLTNVTRELFFFKIYDEVEEQTQNFMYTIKILYY